MPLREKTKARYGERNALRWTEEKTKEKVEIRAEKAVSGPTSCLVVVQPRKRRGGRQREGFCGKVGRVSLCELMQYGYRKRIEGSPRNFGRKS